VSLVGDPGETEKGLIEKCQLIVTLRVSFGGWVYGILFDIYGDYVVVCFIGAARLFASGIVMLIAGLGEARAGTLRSVRLS
jgi:hypothetical protein